MRIEEDNVPTGAPTYRNFFFKELFDVVFDHEAAILVLQKIRKKENH